jgi:hypothetical protein
MKKPTNALMIYALFIDHTYMFRSPSATVLRVYSIKVYGELTDQYNRRFYDLQIQPINHFVMITSSILEFYNIL